MEDPRNTNLKGSIVNNKLHIFEVEGSQSVTYRYRKFPVPGIFNFMVASEKIWHQKSLGTGIGKIWYRKFSEPVSEKFGTGNSQNQYRKNLVPEILRTYNGKIWYRS